MDRIRTKFKKKSSLGLKFGETVVVKCPYYLHNLHMILNRAWNVTYEEFTTQKLKNL